MSSDPNSRLTSFERTSRRVIVQQGAKLAYAVPVVSASMKMSAHAAGAQEVISNGCGVTVSTDFRVDCTSSGQLCTPLFEVKVCSLSAEMVANYTASTGHCSDVLVQFFVDGSPASAVLGPIGPGASTGPVPLAATPGVHSVGIQATGVLGGCNEGVLSAWAGTLSVQTA